MFGKVPEAMLIINNSIYCDEETDGLFHHEMGITDSLFSTERINEYIIRRPYPNKQVCQVSKKIGRNVFKAGYPVLYNDVSELNGRKYLAFDAGLDMMFLQKIWLLHLMLAISISRWIFTPQKRNHMFFFVLSSFRRQYYQMMLIQRTNSHCQPSLNSDFMWRHMKLGRMDIYILHGGRHASTRWAAMPGRQIACARRIFDRQRT